MKVKKYLPSIITLANLFLGFLSILYIQAGEYIFACHLILIAALLDSFDGKLARKIGVTSSFGKEIDSLADVVSFCLAPSFLVFNILYNSIYITKLFSSYDTDLIFIYIAMLSSFPVLMGAIRLARFNVEHNEEEVQKYYIGLPSPMTAIAICAIILFKLESLDKSYNLDITEINFFTFNIILPLIILLSFLMIGKIHFSKFPLFSFSYGKQNSIRLVLMILSIVIMCISTFKGFLHITLFIFSAYYILSNTILHFINNSIKLNKLREKLQNKKRGI
tara:strand:+ start:11244 stop:12074 length:831 start_codon:yes stop_codon:yes gene_type:complete